MVRHIFTHFHEGAFGNRHVNLLNLHLGIVNFGQVLRLSISSVYLLQLGLTLPQVFFAMGALIGLRFILRTPLILIPHAFGSKAALITGQLILGSAFLLFGYADGLGWKLYTALFLMSAGEALYWHAVHTTFATLSEYGKFGRQLAARGIAMSLGSMCAPLLTGIIQTSNGWLALYLLTAASVVISIIPLLFMPEPCPPKPMDWNKGLHVNKAGMKLFAGWGASSAAMAVFWPLIIYFQFGGNVAQLGSMMTITTVISLFISVFIARRIDYGKAKALVAYGALLYLFAVFNLVTFGHSMLTIALLSCCLNLSAPFFTQPYNAALYQWAKETHDPLWFHYWSEFGWDIGNLVVLWGAAAYLYWQPDTNLRLLMLAVAPAVGWCYLTYKRNAPKPVLQAA